MNIDEPVLVTVLSHEIDVGLETEQISVAAMGVIMLALSELTHDLSALEEVDRGVQVMKMDPEMKGHFVQAINSLRYVLGHYYGRPVPGE